MRKLLALVIFTALAGCGGGGAGGPSAAAPASSPPSAGGTTPQSGLVQPQFAIVVPPGASSASIGAGGRTPNFVSSASMSITITLTSVGGNPPNVTPTSATSNISGSSCTSASPCQVNGPPSPPGQADTYSLTTFDAPGGSGNALDTATITITPTAGTQNSVNVVLKGIPSTVTIAGVPTSAQANASSMTALTITVKDHAGQTITGTYSTPVTVTDPDAETVNGTHLTGTNAGPGGCTNSCTTLNGSSDTATLNYGGLAENPVTLTATATGVTSATATFTPLLNAITVNAGAPQTAAAGGGPGIDLFTNDSTSPSGYSGTIGYSELGFTNAPYNKALAITGAGGCSTFANVTIATNTATASAIANPVAGICTITVTDNLTDQTNANPTFKVTYTTSQGRVNARPR